MTHQTVLPRSRLVRVEFTIALPADASLDDIEEWINFETNSTGSMSGSNPLRNYDLEAIRDPLLTDTNLHLHSEVTPLENGHYRTRYWTDEKPFTGPDPQDVLMRQFKSEDTP